jgi:glycosyltransferase involved in cell wall biosynthesis
VRIALLQDRFGLDGRSRVLVRVVELLDRSGHRTTMFTRSSADEVHQAWHLLSGVAPRLRLDVQQLRVPLPKRRASLYSTLTCNLLSAFRLGTYDLVFNSNNYLFVGFAACPVIHYVHFPPYASASLPRRLRGMLGRAYRLPLRMLRVMDGRVMARFRGCMLANSHHTAGAIRRLYPGCSREITVLHPPLTASRARPGSSRDPRRVVTLGRIHPDKAIENVLELANSLHDLSFTIIGSVDSPRYLRKLQREIGERRLSNVQVLTEASASQIEQCLHESSLLLHTAAEEPFGMAICEAMAAGTIPVVPNSAGPAEIVGERTLRYDTLAEARDVLLRLSRARDLEALRDRLRSDARCRFATSAFDAVLLAAIEHATLS